MVSGEWVSPAAPLSPLLSPLCPSHPPNLRRGKGNEKEALLGLVGVLHGADQPLGRAARALRSLKVAALQQEC